MTPSKNPDIPAPGTARRVIPPSKRGRIWVLEGTRLGDNSQAHALAERLSSNYRTLKLVYNRLYAVPNIILGATLATLNKSASDDLVPPWPDLVISAGRRSVPVARWIKAQSGGKTRLVQIGRPRAPLDWFDLVLTTPQYGLPHADNVVQLTLPFVLNPGQPKEHAAWARRFTELPKPWIGVLVGGDGQSFRFEEAEAHKLAAGASRIAHNAGGSLLVSASPRTGRVQSKTIERAAVVPAYVHHWSGPEDNPHRAILALADRFIVTCDSVSMIAEACASGRPVELFPMQPSGWKPSWTAEHGIMETLARKGLLSPPRNMAAVHTRVIASGQVSWLGKPPMQPTGASSANSEQAEAVNRIRSWLDAPG